MDRMKQIDTAYVAEMIMRVHLEGSNNADTLAEVLRVVADELSYYECLPGQIDRCIIHKPLVLEVANKLEEISTGWNHV